MGKGGEAGRAAAKKAKDEAQKALERIPTAPPPFTIGDLRRAIPPHCFKRELVKSFSYLAVDLVVAAVLFLLSQQIDKHTVGLVNATLWGAYWLAQGVVCTGIWVIAHECGHGAFSDYPAVNDTVGFVLHSALLVPYFSWKYSHRRHHSNTGSLDKDEVFVPPTPETTRLPDWICTAPGRALHIVITLTVGWPLYLATNAAGRPYPRFACHFDPWSPIFNDRERLQVAASDAGLAAAFYGLFRLAQAFGPAWVLKAYGVPYIFVNFWLVLITLLQHTHPALPHFSAGEWEWLRGALSTVDRSYGWVLNVAHHHIADTHVCHHLFSTLPHYHAQEATEAIKPILGDYYKSDPRNIFQALWQDWRACRLVAQDADGAAPGVFWYRCNTPGDAAAAAAARKKKKAA